MLAEWAIGLVAQTVRGNAAFICALVGDAVPAGYPEDGGIKSGT